MSALPRPTWGSFLCRARCARPLHLAPCGAWRRWPPACWVHRGSLAPAAPVCVVVWGGYTPLLSAAHLHGRPGPAPPRRVAGRARVGGFAPHLLYVSELLCICARPPPPPYILDLCMCVISIFIPTRVHVRLFNYTSAKTPPFGCIRNNPTAWCLGRGIAWKRKCWWLDCARLLSF